MREVGVYGYTGSAFHILNTVAEHPFDKPPAYKCSPFYISIVILTLDRVKDGLLLMIRIHERIY